MADPQAKRAVYEQLARVGKALAAPRRLELLDVLAQSPRTVEGLADQTAMTIANTSQHLQVLRAAGLVTSEREGSFVTYRIASDRVTQLSLSLRGVAEAQLAEVERVKQRFFAADEGLEVVDGKELLRRVRRGQLVLLDVRPAEEYQAGHLAGALSIPHDQLRRRLAEVPRGRKVIAYCRGPYCVFAVEAVKLLRERGFEAARIEDGVPEWRARGLPIEVGAGRERR